MTFCFLTGCATGRINRAGAEIGRAQAGVTLPVYPTHCRAAVPHAPAKPGDDALSVLKLERAQLDFANTRAANCGNWYASLKSELAKGD